MRAGRRGPVAGRTRAMWKTASILIGIVLVLMTVGFVMLGSTSGVLARSDTVGVGHFVARQAVWIALALVAGAVAARLDYHAWQRLAVPFGLLALALLVMALVPGLGMRIKGSRRWLSFGLFHFQPSELAKIAIVVLLAWWMKRQGRRSGSLVHGLLIPGGILALFAGLILGGPDVGTTVLVMLVGGGVLLVGGARPLYLVVAGAGGFSLLTLAVLHDELRMRRILAFLEPEAYARDEAFQLINALYAFVVGGTWGAGFGQSLQKRYYLPEAHTDFIFAIVGEELGVFASLGVLVLFAGLFACGLVIAVRAPDPFGRLLAVGLTLMLGVQALMNIAVVTGSMPTTGIALPFMSYGGSSLIVSSVMVGMLVNISLHAGGMVRDEDTRAIKDRTHRW